MSIYYNPLKICTPSFSRVFTHTNLQKLPASRCLLTYNYIIQKYTNVEAMCQFYNAEIT